MPECTYDVTCHACEGANDSCTLCGGTGTRVMRECPWRLVKSEHMRAIDAIVAMEFGILPEAGGMQDQSATFVEAFPLLLGELAHWRKVAQESSASK